jgi:3-hydroxyacyl-CoA dehydrogenase
MSESKLLVRKAAVLGAGVMGAQIAAHLVNCGVPAVLFELPAKEGPRNGLVDKAIAGLAKLSPSPLGSKGVAAQITGANYDDHLHLLADCDLIIEAVAERMDIKRSLYAKIAPHVNERAVLASNTSGLSITALSDALPEQLRPRFCGIHFFNPPRYMPLVELIPTAATEPAIIDALEAFVTTSVGKRVVRAKDTPNFIGNRIGVFSIAATMHHTAAFGLGFDVVDALTGPLIGRPKSATYRTSDVVGLDTMAHVIKTMEDTLPNDPWHRYFRKPAWLEALIAKGALGQKTKAGIFRKKGDVIEVLDPATGEYRVAAGEPSADAEGALRQKGWGAKLAALRASSDPQAQFMWACFRDVFHYCAYQLEHIADNARDLDFAIRWGYGWDQGPFEIWQQAGWLEVAGWIQEDIAAGKAMSDAPLPAWVFEVGAAGVHGAKGSYSPAAKGLRERSALPVYARQHFPDAIYTEAFDQGETVFETDGVRMWHQGDGIAIVSFKSKMNTIGASVLAGVNRAIDEAEKHFKALVIWQTGEPFSAGADLKDALPVVAAGKWDEFEEIVATFQRTSQRIKYALVPVVSAVRGMAFGGGCEFQMHSAKAVFALESYVGLVEAGVGLLPAGGGLKEFALRCSQAAIGGDVFQQVQTVFETVAMAKVATSAIEAKEFKLARPGDLIIANKDELLYVAKNEARALADSGYRPPLPATGIKVAGDVGIATIRALLTNMRAGNFVSDHDVEVATRIATVLCGGEVERGSEVDEEWLLRLERKHFVALAQMEKTQARIAHTMKTGKPLRN